MQAKICIHIDLASLPDIPKSENLQDPKTSNIGKPPRSENLQNTKISKIRKCPKSENVQNTKTSKIRKPPKSENLQNPKTGKIQNLQDPKISEIGKPSKSENFQNPKTSKTWKPPKLENLQNSKLLTWFDMNGKFQKSFGKVLWWCAAFVSDLIFPGREFPSPTTLPTLASFLFNDLHSNTFVRGLLIRCFVSSKDINENIKKSCRYTYG